MRIYFDNAATTPMHPDVIAHMSQLMGEVYGNPSSIHQAGRKARIIIEDARKSVAKELNCSIGEVFFTSSATEANNMILRRSVQDLGVKRMIISSIEHPCVLNTVKELEKLNLIDLEILNVNNLGLIDLSELKTILAKSEVKTLVSVMHVNNEIGVIQDIESISKICQENNALFHCDAVQSIAKMPIDLQKVKIDYLSGTSHKFHGPKGVGFMILSNDYTLLPFITGGGQERELRSGTENVPGIAGLAEALKIYAAERTEKVNVIRALKYRFKLKLKAALPEILFLEDENPERFIPTILSVSFPENARTELITFNLDIAGISASAGSACASGVEQASHVLESIKFPEDRRAVRFSFSYFNTEEEVDDCVDKIKKIFS
ncbi:cysteine desulfurase family protein [Portibacter lacus]|uniref:cysteine desulfurase n=1 Tax=Portibacter lacus TaxID=1099794 RepID=A0AA37SLH1_9BACT|nr:cysteine desulfurase family protein [Portibacter lacus]GLR15397.1 cysteine desulfurase [Portibacter lacus]